MNSSQLFLGLTDPLIRASAAALLCSASAAGSDTPQGRGVAIHVLGGSTVELRWQDTAKSSTVNIR